MGGANDTLGLVEICINNGWGGVCIDRFGTNDAEVVCHQLGFSQDGRFVLYIVDLLMDACLSFLGSSIAYRDGTNHFGLGSGPVFLDQLSCVGTESALLDCQARPLGLAECDADDVAGVQCTGRYVMQIVHL